MEKIECDRCKKQTNADSSGERYARIVFEDTTKQTSWYHLCPECEKYFYTNFLIGFGITMICSMNQRRTANEKA